MGGVGSWIGRPRNAFLKEPRVNANFKIRLPDALNEFLNKPRTIIHGAGNTSDISLYPNSCVYVRCTFAISFHMTDSVGLRPPIHPLHMSSISPLFDSQVRWAICIFNERCTTFSTYINADNNYDLLHCSSISSKMCNGHPKHSKIYYLLDMDTGVDICIISQRYATAIYLKIITVQKKRIFLNM